jgi:hypothetical protein
MIGKSFEIHVDPFGCQKNNMSKIVTIPAFHQA